MLQPPRFTLRDVKYADDPVMYARAEMLFRDGKVRNVRENGRGSSAIVESTHLYEVGISALEFAL